MSANETYDEVKSFADEVAKHAREIARLELLIELVKYLDTQAKKTKSPNDRRIYLQLIEHLKGLN